MIIILIVIIILLLAVIVILYRRLLKNNRNLFTEKNSLMQAIGGELSERILRQAGNNTYNPEMIKMGEKMFNELYFILKSLPIGVAIFDKEGFQLYSNDSYLEILGVTDKEKFLKEKRNIYKNPILSTEQQEHIANNDYSKIYINANFEDKSLREYYYSNITDERCYRVVCQHLVQANGERSNIVVIVSDVTDFENQHHTIEEMNHNISVLMETGGFSTWVLDVKSGKRDVIQGVRYLFDVKSPHEYEELFHPDDAIIFGKAIEQLIAGEIYEKKIVLRYIDKDTEGGYKYIEFVGVAKWNVDGKVDKIMCIARNITEQTLHRIKLEQSNTRTRLVFMGGEMTQYDYVVESNSFIVYYSDRLFSGKAVVLMEQYVSMFHPDDLKKNAEYISRMKAGEDFKFQTDYRIRSSENDEWSYMQLVNIPMEKDKNGKVLTYTGLRRDNSKMYKMLLDVENANLLLNTVLDRMPCMFFMKDVEDNFKYVLANDLFCSELGRIKSEVLEHTDFQMLSVNEVDHFRNDDVEVVKMGKKSIREVTDWHNGRNVWQTTKSVFESNGKHYLMGMSTNITELDNTLAELKEAKERAERSDVLKSAFLANMSHEIRTPLNSIVGFADLLVELDDIEKRRELGRIISSNSTLLLNLINNILDMSKIEAGCIDLKKDKVDLSELFYNFNATFTEKMKDGVKFIFTNPYKHCIIESDKDRLSQIVNNYMSNAIKYTPSGRIELAYIYVDDGIKIFVEDTGIGISEENKVRVFQRFEKLDNYAQGTGLGLSICRAIAESLNGKVGFESKKDLGSTFWFWIPCKAVITDKDVGETHAEEPQQVTKEMSKAVKILVAEDNDSNYILISLILSDYKLARAYNGLEVIDMVKTGEYSLVLMDLKMPEMGGLESTQKIRKFNQQIPIIALTANAFDSDREEALHAGCNDFMSKPVKKNELLAVLEKYL